MKINADFSQRVLVHSDEIDWVTSPMAGVDRRPLDRVGDEIARATSIVRYAPGSHFSPHVHTGGEEFLVLDGVFQDEHGDFPVGSYIRNPPQSQHTPGSEPGCVIFVKLWQFELDDRTHVRLQTEHMSFIPHRQFAGVGAMSLYQDDHEDVALYQLSQDSHLSLDASGGAEILVLDGEVQEGNDHLHKHSWLRLPQHSQIELSGLSKTAKVWIKNGALTQVDGQLARVSQAA